MNTDFIYNERQVEALTALFDDPNYNPFDVSHAIEAVANGFATAVIKHRKIVLIPTEANFNAKGSQGYIRTTQLRTGAVRLAYSR